MTVYKTLYAGGSGDHTVYGHIDSSYHDVDSGTLVVNSSGYYDISSTGNTTVYVVDDETGLSVFSDNSFQTGLYLESTRSYTVQVQGGGYVEEYSVTVVEGNGSTNGSTEYDGDASDLTTDDTLYAGASGGNTLYGHIDSYEDWDWGTLVVNQSGYYSISGTGTTSVGVSDDTTHSFYYMQAQYLLNADHTYRVCAFGNTTGENYSVTVTPISVDEDSSDLYYDYIYPDYSGYQTGYGHIDSEYDVDYGILSLSYSGFYELTSTGNIHAYVYDATSGMNIGGGNYIHLNPTHTNYLYVYGYTTGESYSVTVRPIRCGDTDGDAADLNYDYIYPSYSGYQTGYGHTDSSHDLDYGILSLSSSGYYDLISTGKEVVPWVYDATGDTFVSGSTSWDELYLNVDHTYYLYIYGYTPGENYSVTVAPSTFDGDESDLFYDYIYPSYSGYQTGYGHTEWIGDLDYGTLWLSSSGYYDLSFSGSAYGYVYDSTSGTYVYGSSYQSNLYLDASHANYLYVYGSTHGEYYSVTVTPGVGDGDAADLFYDYIYPNSNGSQTGYGHTDSYGDEDYGILSLSSRGYYDITSTGNIGVNVYDATSETFLYRGDYGFYINADHTNYLYVTGYTTGENYSVTVTPGFEDGNESDLFYDYVYPNKTGCGHTEWVGDTDYGTVSLSSSGYYDINYAGNVYVCVYDATSSTNVLRDYNQNGFYLYADHINYLYVTGYTAGESYSVTVTASAAQTVDGDAADLTAADAIYPEYAGYQTGYGHSDSVADVDYGMLYLGASGYFDIGSSGNTAAYIYDATSGQALCGDSYQSRVYVDASHTNCLVVNGYAAGENYSVMVTASAAGATDGDAADLTASDAIYPEYAGYQTGYGHTDSSADVDYGMLYLGTSGYFDISSTGNTAAYIYDATSGLALCGDSYQSRVYVDAAHTNCLVVNGYTAGENYSVTVKASAAGATDGDAADLTASDAIYPEYSGYQTGYGHSDSASDSDYGMLYLGSSGYFDISSSGNTAAYIYDATTGQALYGDSYQSRVYVDASHTNCIVVNGYAAGKNYSVTVKASAATGTDGDSSDLFYDYIYPSYSGYQTGYGHTDYGADCDYGNLVITSAGYYDVTSTGNTEAHVYDATASSWLYGTTAQTGLYMDTAHTYYLYLYGYTTGENYSVTVTQINSIADGDAADWTSIDAIYPSYSGYQTGYGHTDYGADCDYGNLVITSAGYYDVTSTGNTEAHVYDATASSWLYGTTAQSNLYMESGHTYSLCVYGYTTGENYSVSVASHN